MDDNRNLLYIACINRNIDLIESILNSCNKIDEDAYILVCSNGDIEILELIFNNIKYTNKLDIHGNYELGLRTACKNNNLHIMKYLINYGELNNNRFNIYINNNEILNYSCKHNYIDIVRYIFEYSYEHKKQINFNNTSDNIMYHACDSNNIELIEYIFNQQLFDYNISQETYNYIFKHACKTSSLEVVKYLFYNSKYAVDIYFRNGELFINACYRDKPDVIKFLLECHDQLNNNFDIYSIFNSISNKINKYIVQPIFGSNGYNKPTNNKCNMKLIHDSMLNTICNNGHNDMITFIVCYLNNIYNTQHILCGRTVAFINACISDNIDLVKLFIENKYVDEYLNTKMNHILTESCKVGKYKTVKCLLDYSQQHNIYDINSTDLFIKSCRSGNINLVKLLLDYNWGQNNCINLHNKAYASLHQTCMGKQFEMFSFLCDYYRKLNINFDIYQNNFILISLACRSQNIEFVKYILDLDIDKQKCNLMLQHSINNMTDGFNPIVNSCELEEYTIIRYLIEYCFKYNIVIDVFMHNSIIFTRSLSISKFNYYAIQYVLYLSKHNYNRNNNIIFNHRPRHITGGVIGDYILSTIPTCVDMCPDLFITKKYTNKSVVNSQQSYQFINNNNLISKISATKSYVNCNYMLCLL